jgi:hypothetical protein
LLWALNVDFYSKFFADSLVDSNKGLAFLLGCHAIKTSIISVLGKQLVAKMVF